MKIHSIELVGYKRFALRGIAYLHLDFDQKVHQILGTNGSGKSSLLQELSPWPAISQDYHKEGYKRIILSHGDHTYTLLNQFSQPAVHSIRQGDTTELNQSGTWAEQKEWVSRLFGVNAEVHALMLGQVRFTQMGPNERRQWFTRLSDVSYTYALGIFQKLKEQARDVQGALKIAQGLAVQETSRCLSEEEEATLRARVDVLRHTVEVLLNRKPNVSGYTTDQAKALQASDADILRLSREIRQCRQQFLNVEGFQSLAEIEQGLGETRATIHSRQALLERLAVQLERVQTALEAAWANVVQDEAALTTRLAIITENEAALRARATSGLVWPEPVGALSALQMLSGPLSELCTTLPVLSAPYSADTVAETQRQLIDTQQGLAGLEATLQGYALALKEQAHYQTHGQTTCPQCTHTWAIGYDAALVARLTAEQTTALAQQSTLQQTLHTLESQLEHYRQYQLCLHTYQTYVQRWPILTPLWTALKQSGGLRTAPMQVIPWLTQVQQDLIDAIQLAELANEAEKLKALQQAASQQEHGLVDRLQAELQTLQTDYQDYSISLQQAKRLHSRYEYYKTTAVRLAGLEQSLDGHVQQRRAMQTQWSQLVQRDQLNHLIQTFRLELSAAEQTLSGLEMQRVLAHSLQQQVEDLTAQAHALKLLTHELSPTSGLIAQSLLGFIHGYVGQMNRFIQRGWLYPMALSVDLPEDDEAVELDYKFQVRINHQHAIPDIGKTSSGMQEMIDLAFKVVAMQYLGLGDYPLMLDEFSTRMDPAHRQSAYQVIHELIEDSRFSQIFIVSHHYETYGSLRHVDTTVLCDANIALAEGVPYNTLLQIRLNAD